MNSRGRPVLTMLFLSILLLLPSALYFTAGGGRRQNLLPAGDLLPNVLVVDGRGGRFSTDSLTFRRSLVVVFSTQCDHCRELLGTIETMHPELSTYGEVIPISLDDPAMTFQFAQGAKLTVPVYCDTEKKSLPLWNVRTIPAMIVLSDHRRVLNVRSGNISREELRRWVSTAMAQPQGDDGRR